ncbi:MAG: DUF1573 domain-containing protein [Taibaiella sp.]|nr:DUF1573 domain-containing protein [Taibaiella sp.]
MFGTAAEAKEKKNKKKSQSTDQALQLNNDTNLPGTDGSAPAAPTTTLKLDDLAFTSLDHDFGTVQEGPDAVCKFTFVNKGKEPLIIQKAQASCGCTVPTYSKEPIAPGGTGAIDVAFHTAGKPAGGFNKSITITSNAGVRVLNIKGSVEKAPTTSVPENTTMVRTN